LTRLCFIGFTQIDTVICSAWRSDFAKSYAGQVCGKVFFRSTLLQKAIALPAKSCGLQFEADQITSRQLLPVLTLIKSKTKFDGKNVRIYSGLGENRF